MLTAVEGVFKNGRIELCEVPSAVEPARVIVTFLPQEPASELSSARSPSDANRRMLDLLRTWQAEPLSPEDERVLDGFATFQAQHPLRLARLDEEP